METTEAIIHGTRVISSFALAGAVVAGAIFGRIPSLADIADVHAIGAAVGAAFGVIVHSKHLS